MAAEYDGYGRAELADRIVGSITRRTGRVWDKEAEAQLCVWLLDWANRAMAVEWLVYVGEVEDAQFDPMKEFSLREPMAETLMGSQHNQDAGFVEWRRRWWSFRLRPPA